MSVHALGPWRLDATEETGDWQVLDATATSVVADRPSDHEANGGLANARLIAAAPDLLEALEDLLDLPINTKSGLTAYEFVEAKRRRDLARTAVKKAKGES